MLNLLKVPRPSWFAMMLTITVFHGAWFPMVVFLAFHHCFYEDYEVQNVLFGRGKAEKKHPHFDRVEGGSLS